MKISTKNTPFKNLVEGRQKSSSTSIESYVKGFGFLLIFQFSMVSFPQEKPLVKAEIDTTNIRIGSNSNLKITYKRNQECNHSKARIKQDWK